MNGPREKL
ncbi:hypothetical protein AVEN_35866-1, partial [Araneus ventricosus]